MSKRLFREFYLLPRGEQRALIILSLLLILSLGFRVTVRLLPQREPGGMEEFEQEAAYYLAALAEADSLRELKDDSPGAGKSDRAIRADPSIQRKAKSHKVKPIDINRADSTDLLPLPGIGPVFAGRIIKYRELLGGYVSIDQLGEVYGMPGETIQKIRSLVYIDSSAIRKIHVDSASFRELLRHPYLEYEDVKALIEYRDFKGNISSVNDLRNNYILADSTLIMMHGYFDYR
jgi:DNA uptake protein ComE-like DNA-binding protein